MKNTNIFILITLLILCSGFFLLAPLSGLLRIDPILSSKDLKADPVTKDPISKFMLHFSHDVTADPISLDDIDDIVINGNGDKDLVLLEINEDDEKARLECMSPYYLMEVDHQIKNRQLILNLQGSKIKKIVISLSAQKIKSLLLNNLNGQVEYSSRDTVTTSIESFTISKNSTIAFHEYYRDPIKIVSTLNVNLKDESKLSFQGYNIHRLNANIENSLIDVSNVSKIDSLDAQLSGLSHIRGLKKSKVVNQIGLGGNLDYYNKH